MVLAWDKEEQGASHVAIIPWRLSSWDISVVVSHACCDSSSVPWLQHHCQKEPGGGVAQVRSQQRDNNNTNNNNREQRPKINNTVQ